MKLKILAIALVVSGIGISAMILNDDQKSKSKKQKTNNLKLVSENKAQNVKAVVLPKDRPEKFDRYKEDWKVVDSLERKGLVKSGYEKVLKIKEKALRDNNYPQIIKSTIFTIKYNAYLKEDDYPTAVNDLRELVQTLPEPAKSVAHSVLAEIYWGYYTRNRWRIYNRTQVVDMDITDIQTWDLKTIAEQTRNHYMLSVANLDVLKENNISDYSAVLTTLNKENVLRRPTLLDLVGNRAIDFFKNTEFDVPSRSAETFNFNKPYFLEGPDRFADTYLATNDSLSTKFFALKVYQYLTKEHLNDANPIALLDLTLHRLKWAKQKSTLENKDQIYLKTLQDLAKKYADDKVIYPEIMYLIAQKYSADGDKYDEAKGKEYIKEKRRAHEICTEISTKYEGSIGAQYCKQLKNQIESKSMSHKNESAELPNISGIVRFEYKNVPKVYYRIYTYDEKKWNEDGWDKASKKLNSSKPVFSKIIELKDVADFNKHSVEYEIPKLDLGFYIITFSSDEYLEKEGQGWSYSTYRATNLSSKQRANQETEEIEIQVTNRKNGDPVAGASVEVFRQ